MMRNIIYLIAMGISGMFVACQDVTVGYLEADAAKYTVDTLHIINAASKLQRLKDIESAFNENTEDLLQEKAEREEAIEKLDEQYDEEYEEEMEPLYEMMEAPDPDWDLIFDLQTELDAKMDAKYDPLKEAANAALQETEDKLENLAIDMGIGSYAILQKQIADYQQKVNFKLAWTTSEIEGVQGTQPLLFSVIGVKSDNAEAANKFMEYVGVLGNGTIYVEYNVDVIPGNYTVSLQIENEGRTRILNDVFTFVVDAEAQETTGNE